MSTKHYIGTIRVTDEPLYVSDPCYSPDAWCALNFKNIRIGPWRIFVETDDDDEAAAQARHEPIETLAPAALIAEYRPKPYEGDEVRPVRTNVIGEAGVDSGCMAILTEDTFNLLKESEAAYRVAFAELYLSAYQARVVKGAGICETHDGDGVYPVSIMLDDKDMIVGIRIDFI